MLKMNIIETKEFNECRNDFFILLNVLESIQVDETILLDISNKKKSITFYKILNKDTTKRYKVDEKLTLSSCNISDKFYRSTYHSIEKLNSLKESLRRMIISKLLLKEDVT